MKFFRRSLSTSSRTSTADSTSDDFTPRTSLGSNLDRDDEVAASVATIKQNPRSPILSLPVELVQHITSYLDNASSASFCLSSRYIYYALGTETLSNYLEASTSRFEKRRTIETVVERAFPGHWLCAWCDKFHPWDIEDGPMSTRKSTGKQRDCAEFNSYLHAGDDYILRYHHVRLALNSSLWGPEHGLPLSSFSYSQNSTIKIFRTPMPTSVHCAARIVDNHFLLHTTFTISLPTPLTRSKILLKHLWPTLPHLLAGHRDSENGHTGLMAAIDNVLRRGWTYPHTQMCATCATDWTVASQAVPYAAGGQVRLVIRSWRDLGAGRNPFETSWRAHGVGMQECGGVLRTEVVRLTRMRAGDVRKGFEIMGGNEGVDQSMEIGDEGRERSVSRSRIYQSFMRREVAEEVADDVRRSRARPRTWTTRSGEYEDAARREEENNADVVRSIAEDEARVVAESQSMWH